MHARPTTPKKKEQQLTVASLGSTRLEIFYFFFSKI
jgi:hypothetical protein